ncbi:MAG: lycopene cyclase family protein [Pseudomonadota bacterium]
MSDEQDSAYQKELEPAHGPRTDADVLIVGGSLANCLSALWLTENRPNTLIGLVDAAPKLLAGRQWLFFDCSVPRAQYRGLRPYISKRWNSYQLCAGGAGPISGSLAMSLIDGDRMRAALEAAPRIEVLERGHVTAVANDAVELGGEDLVSAPLVLDGRPVRNHRSMLLQQAHVCTFEISCATPHGVDVPVLMHFDADEQDQPSYLQILPTNGTSLMVDVVRLSEEQQPDAEAAKASILRYGLRAGIAVSDVRLVRQWSEPFLTGLQAQMFAKFAKRKAVPTGQAALLSHPTTLSPVVAAAELAAAISQLEDISTEAAMPIVAEMMQRYHGQYEYFYQLNQTILEPGSPQFAMELYEHLHGLPESLIERFYRGDCRSRDRLRISMVRTGHSLVKAGIAFSKLGAVKRTP